MEEKNSLKEKMRLELVQLRKKAISMLEKAEDEVDPLKNGEDCFWWESVCNICMETISSVNELLDEQ